MNGESEPVCPVLVDNVHCSALIGQHVSPRLAFAAGTQGVSQS